MKLILRNLLFFPLFIISLSGKAQTPAFSCYITNEIRVSPTVYQFDIYLLRTGTAVFEYGGGQWGIAVNSAIANGGTLTASIVLGSGQLTNASQTPTTAAIYLVGGTYYFNVAAKIPPGTGNGAIISSNNGGCASPGSRIASFQISNTVPFTVNTSANHVFNFITAANQTQTEIFAYVNGINTDITGSGTFYSYNTANSCLQNISSVCDLTASVSSTSNNCFGENMGTVSATPSGGITPLNYLWTTGQTTQTITDLPAGAYTVTITDAGSCISAATATVTQPDVLNAACSETNVSCNGINDGSASVIASGGVSPYSYLWNNGKTTATINNLSPDAYSVTVTDSHGCIAFCSSAITEPLPLNAPVTVNGGIACHGGTTTVTVSASGGTSPYNGTGTFTVSAGSYSYTVTDANGCTSNTSITVTEPSALSASVVQNAAILCHGATTTVTVSASGGTTPYDGTGTFTVGAGSYSYTVTDANGCTGNTSITVTEPSALSASVVQDAAIFCHGGTTTITVSSSGGDAPYNGTGTFTVGAGGYSYTVTDANGCKATTSITVSEPDILVATAANNSPVCAGNSISLSSSATGGKGNKSYLWAGPNSFTSANQNPVISDVTMGNSGIYTVTVTDENGCTSIANSTVTVIIIPAPPGAINGPAAGVCNSSQSYNIASVSGATSYTWTAPAGASVSGGQGTSSVTVSFTSTFTSGSLSVTANNSCGSSSLSSITITAIPATPAAITGPTIACLSTTKTYSTTPVFGATSYTWKITTGATITSGQGTTSITVSFGSSWVAGTLTVTATNACGTTNTASSLAIISKPAIPGDITGPITGVCLSTNSYSVSPVNGATSYTWIAPLGATIASGQGTPTVTVTFTSAFTKSGTLSVTASNSCGTSTAKTLTVSSPLPATPGVISGPSTGVCRSTQTYSVTPVFGATSYTWTLSVTTATITSGQGTNTVNINFGNTFSTCTLTVKSANACGTQSTGRILVINALPPITGAISGPSAGVCRSTQTYSVTPVSGATSYTWALSVTTATITSGQGTNAVAINFGNTFTTCTLTVKSANVCGTQSTASLLVIKAVPATPTAISGPTTGVCLSTQTYSITPIFGATSYTWTAPLGATVTSGQGTTTVAVTFTSAFTKSGTLSVAAKDSCGTGSSTALIISSPLPATPGPISGPVTGVCRSTQTYSITPVSGATSYTWALSVTTATIASGQGTNTVAINFGNTFTTCTLTVKSVNACGTQSVASSLVIKAVSATPGAISGRTSVCTGAVESYSTTPVFGATSYTWAVPTGCTITGGQGTANVTVKIGSAAGNITAIASNVCGNSTASSLAIAISCRLMSPSNLPETENNTVVYPNPTQDQLYIKINQSTNEAPKSFGVMIFDILGKQIKYVELVAAKNSDSSPLVVDVSALVAGIYFVRIQNENGATEIKKFIKE